MEKFFMVTDNEAWSTCLAESLEAAKKKRGLVHQYPELAALAILMKDRNTWVGTLQELYDDLTLVARTSPEFRKLHPQMFDERGELLFGVRDFLED